MENESNFEIELLITSKLFVKSFIPFGFREEGLVPNNSVFHLIDMFEKTMYNTWYDWKINYNQFTFEDYNSLKKSFRSYGILDYDYKGIRNQINLSESYPKNEKLLPLLFQIKSSINNIIEREEKRNNILIRRMNILHYNSIILGEGGEYPKKFEDFKNEMIKRVEILRKKGYELDDIDDEKIIKQYLKIVKLDEEDMKKNFKYNINYKEGFRIISYESFLSLKSTIESLILSDEYYDWKVNYTNNVTQFSTIEEYRLYKAKLIEARYEDDDYQEKYNDYMNYIDSIEREMNDEGLTSLYD